VSNHVSGLTEANSARLAGLSAEGPRTLAPAALSAWCAPSSWS